MVNISQNASNFYYNSNMNKECPTCHQIKEPSEYNLSHGRPSGRCKKCKSDWYLQNKVRILEKQKYRRETDEKYRENMSAYGKKYRQEHPEYYNEYYSKIKGTEKYDKYLETCRVRSRNLSPELKKKYASSNKNNSYLTFSAKIRNNLTTTLNSRLLKNLGFKFYGIDCRALYSKLGDKPSPLHHLDHIIPSTAFDLSNRLHVNLAYSPHNLRWVLASSNVSKGSIINYAEISSCPELIEIANILGIFQEHDGVDARTINR